MLPRNNQFTFHNKICISTRVSTNDMDAAATAPAASKRPANRKPLRRIRRRANPTTIAVEEDNRAQQEAEWIVSNDEVVVGLCGTLNDSDESNPPRQKRSATRRDERPVAEVAILPDLMLPAGSTTRSATFWPSPRSSRSWSSKHWPGNRSTCMCAMFDVQPSLRQQPTNACCKTIQFIAHMCHVLSTTPNNLRAVPAVCCALNGEHMHRYPGPL